ncbi:MAG: hypothetical protein CVV63_03110, partial [Tenericutes bacterium HGW-Tenericutes-8]
MEFCKRDGYCMSADFDSTGRLVFTYYDLGIHNQDTLYIASANKKEESIIIDQPNVKKLFDHLCQNQYTFSQANLYDLITNAFQNFFTLKEIKSFLGAA